MTNKNSTYKRLGDYIREVDVRNTKKEVNLSQGICNQKYFQNPRQVSATPHLDKIVRKGQFAYNRATTRNGNKISIAYREGEDCTVSSAYCVFYIVDENILNPYYLWLWFKKPDFDRYAIFKSHGSAHEFFEFETLCDTYVPIPSIEEQRKIVDHYLAIQNRIANNKQTIAKLEEAAQALYRKMFVDDVDVENLPDGWRMGTIEEISEKIVAGTIPKYDDTSSYMVLG
jgi:type I restriction enzyme S subunit